MPSECGYKKVVLRYLDSLRHALQCRKAERRQDSASQRKFYRMMLKEDADAALLRVFECFLESAPQLVLQMTIIMIQTANTSPWQCEHHLCLLSFNIKLHQ